MLGFDAMDDHVQSCLDETACQQFDVGLVVFDNH
jgi:hypothetical protein